MKTTSRHQALPTSGADRYTVITQLTSMVMYVECCVAAGMTFGEAKERAIANAIFVGATKQYASAIVSIIREMPFNALSGAARSLMMEAAYQIVLQHFRKRDTIVRRCAYMWFGLVI